MDILDFFPFEKPHPSQIQVLHWVQENWAKYDIFVLQCPVAAGKSPIAVTIARWSEAKFGWATRITTPDNVLVKQYQDDFDLPGMPYVSQYAMGDSFKAAQTKAKNEPLVVMNNWSLLANRAYAPLQIMDEAHQLIPMLQDFEGIKWWLHLDDLSDTGDFRQLRTVGDIVIHFQRIKTALTGIKNITPTQRQHRKMAGKILKSLSKNPKDFVVAHEQAEYRGKLRDCLRIYPLTPRGNAPILWPPSRVRKLILMSATIERPDIYDLGLESRRVGYISVPSDIPPENRPVYLWGVGSMGQGKTDTAVDALVERLQTLRATQAGRGFIHSTYALARQLRDKLDPDQFIVHDQLDKSAKWEKWRNNLADTRSFVGCGMTTGINMKGDIARWQAILKCPFPDLGDVAVRGKYLVNEEWYAWATIKQLLQAYGRVCRGPEDFGATFILDSDFIKLYNKHVELFPQWFREAHSPISQAGVK